MSVHAKLIAAAFPAFLKEDYPRAADALAEYYEWECTSGALASLSSHEAHLDVDRDGLDACIDEMGFSDIPATTRRSFVAWSREFLSSRGSMASWSYLASAFGGEAVPLDTAQFMLEPSAASRISGVVVMTTGPVVRRGRFTQAYAGLDADIVESWSPADGFTAYALASVNAPVVPGPASAGGVGVTVVSYNEVEVTGGRFFTPGDVVEVETPAGVFAQRVVSVEGLPTGFTVVSAGSGYAIGDAVVVAHTRCRGEVAEVGAAGEIVAARLLSAEGFAGVPVITVKSKAGVGAVLAVTGNPGRPRLDGDKPFGGITAVRTTTGEGFAFTARAVMTAPFTVQTSQRGVIGVASTLTDSSAYSDGAYVVTTQGGDGFWGRAKELLHPSGRYVWRREAASLSYVSSRHVTSTSQPWAPLDAGPQGGEDLSAGLAVTPNFSPEGKTGETLAVAFVKTAFLSPELGGGESLAVDTLS